MGLSSKKSGLSSHQKLLTPRRPRGRLQRTSSCWKLKLPVLDLVENNSLSNLTKTNLWSWLMSHSTEYRLIRKRNLLKMSYPWLLLEQWFLLLQQRWKRCICSFRSLVVEHSWCEEMVLMRVEMTNCLWKVEQCELSSLLQINALTCHLLPRYLWNWVSISSAFEGYVRSFNHIGVWWFICPLGWSCWIGHWFWIDQEI